MLPYFKWKESQSYERCYAHLCIWRKQVLFQTYTYTHTNHWSYIVHTICLVHPTRRSLTIHFHHNCWSYYMCLWFLAGSVCSLAFRFLTHFLSVVYLENFVHFLTNVYTHCTRFRSSSSEVTVFARFFTWYM